jgi:hypothetical protein
LVSELHFKKCSFFRIDTASANFCRIGRGPIEMYITYRHSKSESHIGLHDKYIPWKFLVPED